MAKRRREARAKIDPSARCPFCGHRKGKIFWNEASKTVIHGCEVCSGTWSEKPIVDFDKWNHLRPPVEVPVPAAAQKGKS